MRALLLSTLSLALGAQTSIPLSTKLNRVRIHPNEAWITRTGSHRFEQGGTFRFVVRNLPPHLRLQDLRVTAKGPEGTRLGDVALKSDPLVVTESEEWKSLQQEKDRIQSRIEDLQAEGESLAQESAFLKQLMAQHRDGLAAHLTYATPKAESVVDLSKGIHERLHAVLTRDGGRQRDLVRAHEERVRLEHRILQQSDGRQASPSTVRVEVSLPRAGRAELELTYRNGESRWEPQYEARLSEDRKRLEMVLFAAVRQSSGESWEGVSLEISSAHARRNLAPVKYDQGQNLAWYDHPSQGKPKSPQRREGAEVMVEVVASTSGSYPPSRPTTYAPEPPPVAAQDISATRQEETKGISTLFALEGQKDIPADGEPHRFRILSASIDPNLALITTPRLDPTIYQIARFAPPAALPIFPGAPIVHFAGTQRLGESTLAAPPSGEAFQLPFGPYQGLRIHLRRREARRDTVGTFSKDRLWTLREGIEVSNDTPESHLVEIYDRILSASDDKVKVTILPETTPSTDVQPGVRRWTLDVAPRSLARVNLAQQIRGPLDGYIAGLEGLQLP